MRVLYLTLSVIGVFFAGEIAAQSYRVTHDSVELIVPGEKTLPLGGASEVVASGGIVWNIYYEDQILGSGIGFDAPSPDGPDRRARMRDCIAYISSVLNQPGELDLMVGQSFKNPENPPPGSFLARGGTGFDCSIDFSSGYAFHRLTTGSKAMAGEEDIFIQFNFNYAWHAGTAPAPGSRIDLQTVLLHEITHGLGLMGIADEDGSSLLTGCTPPATGYTVWDGLLQRGNTGNTLFGGQPLRFLGIVPDLQSGDVVFSGMSSILGYDQEGLEPAVYAPSPFRLGSSLAHFGTNQIVGGPVVMEHAVSAGSTLRTYHPLEIGALRDIGYEFAADPDDPGCDGLGGEVDACGVCRGDGQSCLGCDGIPNSGTSTDSCGDCGGEGLACFRIDGQGGFRLEGERLEFRVTGPSERIQWLRDGVPLAGETGSILVIAALGLLDSGTYVARYESQSKSIHLSNPIRVEVVTASALAMDMAGPVSVLLFALMGVCWAIRGGIDVRLRFWKAN